MKLRPEPAYRRDAFVTGLKRLGYSIVQGGEPTGAKDLLVQWNRKPPDERDALAWEQAGGTVIVCENGYVGKDANGLQSYAISAHAHNGAGWFPVDGENRFVALNIQPPQPWRASGSHILVCGQRGVGSKDMASPSGWQDLLARRIRRTTTREVRIRPHPGNKPALVPLGDDLAGAWACVIWSSACGVRALLSGIPVFYEAPHWICEGAALRGTDEIEQPVLSDVLRLQALQKMAYGQWFVDEIATGTPFERITSA